VGTRPTVNDSIRANVEVHLLDFSGNLYGKTISVNFRNKLRDEKKFSSLDELKQQIQRDIESAREFLGL
jgi:riboflavin kinase/FMN adenylyltransferase